VVWRPQEGLSSHEFEDRLDGYWLSDWLSKVALAPAFEPNSARIE
jgi:hypothetical protein